MFTLRLDRRNNVLHLAGVATLMQQFATTELGRRLTTTSSQLCCGTRARRYHDGDDEDDNVRNLNVSYQRLDVVSLAEAVLAMTRGAAHTVDVTAGGEVDGVDFGVARVGATQAARLGC